MNRRSYIRSRLAASLAALALLCIVVVPSGSATAATGANVNESLVGTTLYVDPVVGMDDPGRGTLGTPLRTLGEALARAQSNRGFGTGTKIVLADGTYRETNSLSAARVANAPIVIEAVNQGQAILSGSDVVTNWEARPDGTYRTPWAYEWGVADPIWPDDNGNPRLSELGRRSELVHVNGERYRQVPSQGYLGFSSITEIGGYWVDEQPGGNGYIYVRPKNGVNFNSATIEVSTRRENLFEIDTDDVVVRCLTLQYQAGVGGGGTAALWLKNSNNVLIDKVTVRNNNAGGMSLSSNVRRQDYTVRDSRFEENGFTGNGASRIDNLLFENVEARENNWRGFLGGMTGWAVAGIKHLLIDDGTYNNVTAQDNQTHGLWFDTDNTGISVNDLISNDNLRYGVYVEANDGDITLTNATLTQNETGLFIANQMNLTVQDSTIVNNLKEQVSLDQRANQQLGPSGDRGNRNLQLLNNLIGSYYDTQKVIANNNFTPEGQRWIDFLATFTGENNTYFHPTDTMQFPTEDWDQIDFDAWVASLGGVGEETGSRFILGVVIPEPASICIPSFGGWVLSRRLRAI